MLCFDVHPVSASPAGHTSTSRIVVAIIPARFHSTRLPGKPLAEIGGRPMIEHVYRRALAATSVDRVIVATDDERVRAAVDGFGGHAVLTDPAHRSGTDRLAEVAAGLSCDIVVNVQGDEPLLEPRMLAELLGPFERDPSVQMCTLRRRLEDPAEWASPHVVKVVVNLAGEALYFSRAPIPHPRDALGAVASGAAFKHIGLYAYRRELLLTLARLEPTRLELVESLEQLRALEHGYRIHTVETAYDSVGVDTPEDLEQVRRLLADSG
jgi:3-deoxy-manno-octulosonate cytidylyltransferase (CMP-KDO synthetase)